MLQDPGHELLGLGARYESTAVALQGESPEIPFAQDILHWLAIRKTLDATTHRFKAFLVDVLPKIRGESAAPSLEKPRSKKLGGDLRIRDRLRLQVLPRLGNRVAPSHRIST